MNISGLTPITPTRAPETPEPGLRLFQRITAQVLTVTGTAVVLSIDGQPIVAQLTSSDQAAALFPRQTAQFIVTKLNDEAITLKLLRNDPAQPPATAAGPELALRLLEQNNLPVTANHLMMARSVLKQNLPISPGLLNELLGAMPEDGSWGSAESDLAAALKAAGLPVTAETLKLAARQPAPAGQALAGLIAQLSQAAGQDLPPEVLAALRQGLQTLNGLVVNSDGNPARTAEQLKTAISLLGRSIENLLLEPSSLPEANLGVLLRLRDSLEQAGKTDLSHAIHEFVEDLRQNQFLNAKPDPAPGRENWAEVSLMLQTVHPKTEEEYSQARLRVLRKPGAGTEQSDPDLTRLLLQVEVTPGEVVEIAIDVTGQQIRTTLTAADALWCENARQELPSFEQALQALGFTPQGTRIEQGKPSMPGRLLSIAEGPILRAIDIEV